MYKSILVHYTETMFAAVLSNPAQQRHLWQQLLGLLLRKDLDSLIRRREPSCITGSARYYTFYSITFSKPSEPYICDHNQHCKNTVGSYYCACDSDRERDNGQCHDKEWYFTFFQLFDSATDVPVVKCHTVYRSKFMKCL